MRYPQEFVDELRARLPVSEVVGRKVKLRRRGREFVGLSPFNKEKTPSFTVNDQKGFYHDFSSGKHGDIFAFAMEMEGLTFPEAVELLASMAGLPLPQMGPKDEEARIRRERLLAVMDRAASFYHNALFSSVGDDGAAYLGRRGVTHGQCKQFRIGYSPTRPSLLWSRMAAAGILPGDAVDAGLVIDDGRELRDRFYGRVMFPITDWRGQVVAFGARTVDGSGPKYINSPDTPLFSKGTMLYNGAAARNAAKRGAPVIVVEGYMDVIAMVCAGFEGAVSTMGTALTEVQLDVLWRMSGEPVLCFDGDDAGKRAASRAIDLVLPRVEAGKTIRIAEMPVGTDPDDLAKKGRAPIEEVLLRASPLFDALWNRELSATDVRTPEGMAALGARVLNLCRQVTDEGVRTAYEREAAARIALLSDVGARQFIAGAAWLAGKVGWDKVEFGRSELEAAALEEAKRMVVQP